jgi:hypothetical protein
VGVIVYPVAFIGGVILSVIIAALSFLAAFVDSLLPQFLAAAKHEIRSFFNHSLMPTLSP